MNVKNLLVSISVAISLLTVFSCSVPQTIDKNVSVATPNQATTVTLQAENATISGGSVASSYSGYSGTGYVDMTGTSGSYVEFTVNATAAGSASVKVYYANGTGSSVTYNLTVNGSGSTKSFSSGAWTTWSSASRSMTLVSGSNKIRLTATAATTDGINFDKIEVTGSVSDTSASSSTAAVSSSSSKSSSVTTVASSSKSASSSSSKAASSSSSSKLGSSSSSKAASSVSANIVVASDGSGNYTTVQAAINSISDNNSSWKIIYIKDGTYKEVVTISSTKTYIHLLGQSNTGTIITYSNCNSTAGGTEASSTVFVKAKNFIAENIYFKNDFDYDNSSVSNKQAVALAAEADRQVYKNCRFHSHQDTLLLWSGTGRQYFTGCYIEGHTDFIFGNGTAVFDNCEIYSLTKSGASICAPSTYESTTYGLIFMNCTVSAGSNSAGTVYLGRPWHPSSSSYTIQSMAVYFKCTLGAHIQTAGWTSMSGVSPSTERMYEYLNTGSGAVTNSSRTQLSSSTAANYTVTNILGGSDSWDPTTL
jgi:pectinesterase